MDKNPKIEILDINDISLNTGQIKGLPQNPRFIKDEKFNKLVKSVKEFPQMLSIRPIVVNENGVILGGNMRYRACQSAGLKKIPVIVVKDLSLEQTKQFLIKDNVGFGQWDYDILGNEWEQEELDEWGLETFSTSEVDLGEFFEDDIIEKESKNKIVLEYSSDDFEIINSKLNSLDGSREDIIWKALEL